MVALIRASFVWLSAAMLSSFDGPVIVFCGGATVGLGVGLQCPDLEWLL